MLKRALLLVVLYGCGGSSSPSPSTPPPTTQPSPLPSHILVFPLAIAGHNFVDPSGRPVQFWPEWDCCWDKERTGWPGMNVQTIQEIADSGGNAVGIRLGPHSNRRGAPDPEAAPGTGFLRDQVAACRSARVLGVACIVSVVDCWGIRTGNNFYGWLWAIIDSLPTGEVERWVAMAVTPFSDLDNVLFETGNECFDFEPPSRWIGSSLAWELGIRDLIRHYAPGKFIGTNTHASRIEAQFDIVFRHSETFIDGPVHNKPTIVNEYRTLTPEVWERNAVRALEVGTIFGLWIGGMSPAQRNEAFQRRVRLTQ